MKKSGFRIAAMAGFISALGIGQSSEILKNKKGEALAAPLSGPGRYGRYLYADSKSNRSSPRGKRARRRSFKANRRAGL